MHSIFLSSKFPNPFSWLIQQKSTAQCVSLFSQTAFKIPCHEWRCNNLNSKWQNITSNESESRFYTRNRIDVGIIKNIKEVAEILRVYQLGTVLSFLTRAWCKTREFFGKERLVENYWKSKSGEIRVTSGFFVCEKESSCSSFIWTWTGVR